MPARKGIIAMKEVLKLWYSGALKGKLHEPVIILVAALFAYFSVLSPMSRSEEIGSIIIGFSFAILLGVASLVCLWTSLLYPLFAIIRFKQRFSFLPPSTHEGRIAMQPKVDFELHQAAKRFFLLCDEEKKLVSELTNTTTHTDLAKILTPQEITAIEKTLAGLRKDLVILKKQFWQKHAAAKNDLLPAAFEVYPSIHNYETNPPRKTVPKKKKLSPPSLDMVRHTEAIDSLEKRTRSGRIK